MNFATLSPVNYGITQPELTPLSKRMSDVLTLRDMMDKQKLNKMAMDKASAEMADAERKRRAQESLRQQAQTELEAYNTVPEVPVVDPISSTQGLYPEVVAPTVPGIGGQSQELGINAITPKPIISSIPGQVFSLPQVQDPEERAQQQAISNIPSQVMQSKFDFQDKQVQDAEAVKALQDPETRIPKGYQWMSPDEYGHFIKAQSLDPEYATQYKKDLVDQKYKLAQTETADTKSKGMKDYLAGSILKSLGTTATPDQAVAALIAGGLNPIDARKYADTKEATLSMYEMSAPVLAQKKAETDAKKAENEAILAAAKDARDQARLDLSNKQFALEMSKFGLTREQAQDKVKIKNDALSDQYEQAKALLDSGGIDKYLGAGWAKRAERGGRELLGDPGYTDFDVKFKAFINQEALKVLASQPGVKTDKDFQVARESTQLDPRSTVSTKAKLQKFVDFYENKYLSGATLVDYQAIKPKVTKVVDF